ncbi:interleukin-10 receptor subunit beta [Chanos chanos]|uniref:Interleukin-10 receptor subunit beta n=1 Tax=Chanos chanos TaxID=29144 RepID=A0A6J2WDR4_CHACN|nr:interleukin-10 receptor subunit beta-like [Chanos chanos]
MNSALLTILLVLCATDCGVTGVIPPPDNVKITSFNMGLVLEWDPPQNFTNDKLTYTAEYLGWKDYEVGCINYSSLSCDFTDFLSVFGLYSFRVRSELSGETSDWVVMNNVAVYEITTIGPPVVTLQSSEGEIDVRITEPVLRNGKLQDVYGGVYYNISYWKEGEETETKLLTSEQTWVVLPNIESLARYCVKVQIFSTLTPDLISLPSNETCITNTSSGKVQPWLIVVILFVSFLLSGLVVLLLFGIGWCSYKGIRFLYPKAKLPEHFKQCILEPSISALFLENMKSKPVELYHEVSIVTENSDKLPQCPPQAGGSHGTQADRAEKSCGVREDGTTRSEEKAGSDRTTTPPVNEETEQLLQL